MWMAILSFLGGPFITGALDAYKARLKSINSTDAMAVDLLKNEVLAEIQARADATKVIIAEQGRWFTAIIRPLFAVPFIVFEFKVIIWDKVLGWGVTDKIDPMMWGVFQTIIISYFGSVAVERVTQILKR